jgi:hypothetical protein
MSVKLVEAGPPGHRYRRPATQAESDALVKCIEGYALVDEDPQLGLYVASSIKEGPSPLVHAAPQLRDPSYGVAVQLPDLVQAGLEISPPDLLCVTPSEFPFTVALLFTRSLNEARGMLSTPSSFVLREPSGGWIETGKPIAASSISWGRLAVAGALIAVAGYLVFR